MKLKMSITDVQHFRLVVKYFFDSTVVNKGINSMVSEMKVGQKVQAIIPPELAFGEKGKTKICVMAHGLFVFCTSKFLTILSFFFLGICLEDGECLVKPGSTLVYDIFLKKASIPPP